MPEEVAPCLPFTITTCAFTDFFRHADAESYFDVKAIVIHAFPTKQVKAKSFQRDLVIIDERKTPMILTLWDEFANEEGLQIENLFPAITIIIARNVKATTFHGLSLSYMMINPPLPDSLPLRSWCHDNKAEINNMLENKAYKDPSILLPALAGSDVLIVAEALSALPQRKTAWVIDGFELRSNVPIQLTEGENTLSVTLKSPDVQLLTNITPQYLRDSHEFGLDAQDELKAALEKLTIVSFWRSKKKEKDEPETNEPVRYTAVKAYDAGTLGVAQSFSSPTKNIAKDAASDDKQLFTPTLGNVAGEIATEQEEAQRSVRIVSAKRNIAFVSETGTSDHAAGAAHQESAVGATTVVLDATKDDAGSPLKKPKDKVKLN